MKSHSDYECPNCGDWIEILRTTAPVSPVFDCPWCGEPLTLDADGEFDNGLWRDRSKLISALPQYHRQR